MDTTNVNSGEKAGLKRLLKHAVPLGCWIGCGNHKIALCFKHLLGDFPVVFSADATLLCLWKFFHYRPLAVNFLKNAAEAYEEAQVTPVCPSVTRWTAHDRACKGICEGYSQILSALTTCVNERKEPDALGIFVEVSSKSFLATILMLRDVFAGIQPLNLVLQKAGESLCLADIPVYLDKTISSLEKLRIPRQRSFFRKDKHDDLINSAAIAISSLPPSAATRSNLKPFDLNDFEKTVFIPFLDAFIVEVQEAFSQLDFWLSFVVFDPRKLPEDQNLLDGYGDDEISNLLGHYGVNHSDEYEGKTNHQAADLNTDEVLAE